MKDVLFGFLFVFIGVVIGCIARGFNASPSFQFWAVPTSVAIVMFIYYRLTGVFK